MQEYLKLWYKNTKAATAIEYSLIAAGIALAIVTAVFALGPEISLLFNQLTAWM